MNWKATLYSALCSLGATFLLTWVNEAQALHAWGDLGSFAFWTKVVTTGVTIGGISTWLAHKSFRDPGSRTRSEDSRISYPGPGNFSPEMTPERRAKLESIKARNADEALGLRRRPIGDVSTRE